MSRRSVNVWPETGSRRGVRRERRGAGPGTGVGSPAWAREAVLYSVYPRAMSPEGDFEGVRRRLPWIRELGSDAIWLLPIHPTGEAGRKGSLGSPYAVRDYRAVNPEYGTEADLRRLVDEAHQIGLKVIIDLVLNHAALDHPLAARPGWAHRDGRGRLTRRIGAWSDVTDWNFAEAAVRMHHLEAMEHWVREFGIDGYRCDVAGMVPADFWREARARLLQLRSDHFMLAEWDDPALHRAAFHASYDWELYRAALDAARRRRPASDLPGILARRQAFFPAGAQPLRFVENHDNPRAPRRFGAASGAITIFTAFSGGIFLVHNGQEIGAVRRPSLFDRDPFDWDRAGAGILCRSFRNMLRVRSLFHNLGPPEPVPVGSNDRLAAYRRRDQGRTLVVVINLGGQFARLAGRLAEEIRPLTLLWPTEDHPGSEAIPPKSALVWGSPP